MELIPIFETRFISNYELILTFLSTDPQPPKGAVTIVN
jgi:hypothetical protein